MEHEKINQHIRPLHPEVTNISYSEHQKQEQLKKIREEIRKKEELKKMKKVEETVKSLLKKADGKIRSNKEVDQIL